MMILSDKKTLSIEITTTQKCNMACSYCFEGEELQNKEKQENVEDIILKIKELYNSPQFKIIFNKIQITFWGGEPTLAFSVCNKIITGFKDMNVDFFFYTNGYSFINTKNILDHYTKEVGDDYSRIKMQVSYDGIDNDNERIDHSGLGTSEKIFMFIELMNKHFPEVKLSLKSTILPEQLKTFSKNWKHFEELNERFISYNFTYSPTIEYTNTYNITEDDLNIIKLEFLKIAKLEEHRYYNNKPYLLSWFKEDNNKHICTAGTNIINIDLQGNITPCHGALYSKNKKDLIITNIMNNDFINSFFLSYNTYFHNLTTIGVERKNEICEGCDATVCYQCPTTNYDNSSETNKYKKYYDIKTDLCKIYDLFGKISKAFKIKLQ